MKFSHGDYRELLRLYNTRVSRYSDPQDDRLIHGVACSWLNQETAFAQGNYFIKNYKRWSIVGTSKPKLRIGGIFPLNGSKFNAPELLPGMKGLEMLINYLTYKEGLLTKVLR